MSKVFVLTDKKTVTLEGSIPLLFLSFFKIYNSPVVLESKINGNLHICDMLVYLTDKFNTILYTVYLA